MRVHSALLGVGATVTLAVAAVLAVPRMLPHPAAGRQPAAHATAPTRSGQAPVTQRARAGLAGAPAGTANFTAVAGTAATPARAAASAPAAPAAASGATTGGGLGDVVARRVEETAAVTLRVQDVGQGFDAVTALASTLGGYVVSSNLQTGAQTSASAQLELALPQARLGTFLKDAGGLGKVLATQVGGQDVTQQYVDLQGRLTALQAERQSYLTLLGKATSIGDILQIQSQLTDVQTQIENLTGQLRVLNSLSAMAHVTVTLTPVPAPVPPKPAPKPVRRPSPAQRVAAALLASLHAMLSGATALAEALVWVAPWVALAGGGYVVYRRVARARA